MRGVSFVAWAGAPKYSRDDVVSPSLLSATEHTSVDVSIERIIVLLCELGVVN